MTISQSFRYKHGESPKLLNDDELDQAAKDGWHDSPGAAEDAEKKPAKKPAAKKK